MRSHARVDFLGAGNLQNSHNTFKGIVFRDKERVCVPITSSYSGYQRSFSRVGLEYSIYEKSRARYT